MAVLSLVTAVLRERRQGTTPATSHILAGVVILLITASVDYQLLDMLQHPLAILAPLVLALIAVGVIMIWQVGQLPAAESPPAASLFLPVVPAMVVGALASLAVFSVDRAWIEKIDMPLPRLGAIVLLLGAPA